MNISRSKFTLLVATALIAIIALAACAPAPTPTPVPPPPTAVPPPTAPTAVPPTATRVPPTATSAPTAPTAAELPVKWFLARAERIPNGAAPTEVKLTTDGEDTTKAADGSTLTTTGNGSFDPTSKKAAGSGKFTVKDSAGAVKSQGNWQVTDFVSWQQIAGGFPAAPPPKFTTPPPSTRHNPEHRNSHGQGKARHPRGRNDGNTLQAAHDA